MPLPPPPPGTVFDIVKSHVHLPINGDYGALKRVLREWLAYNTQRPLQEKPTFPAELVVTVTRASSSSPTAADAAVNHEKRLQNASPGGLGGGRRWRFWRAHRPDEERTLPAATSTSHRLHSAARSGNATTVQSPQVFRKVVPLHVWTAVLPWEMQRGLSFSHLQLSVPASSPPAPATLKEAADAVIDLKVSHAPGPPEAPPRQGGGTGCRAADPYGVVTPGTPTPHRHAHQTAYQAGGRASATPDALSITPPVPAMLFLSDTRTTRACGLGFWSGAIRQPIDVLFVGPTLPSSVSSASASFCRLRQRGSLAHVKDNVISPEVLTRYFPLQEMGNPSSTSLSSSTSSITFRVHSFGHLDPLPPSIHPSRLDIERIRQGERRTFTVSPDAPFSSPEEAPRYVFEVPRYTLQTAVAAALRESRERWLEQDIEEKSAGSPRAAVPEDDADSNTSIDVAVNLSASLKADLLAKAQLCVEYVAFVEDAIASYARLLSTEGGAGAEAPLEVASEHHGSEGGADRRQEKVKVWLSEHTYQWMTREELEAAAAVATSPPAAQACGSSSPGMAASSVASAASQEEAALYANEQGEISSTIACSSSVTLAASAPPATSPTPSAVALDAARAVGAQPAQPHAVSAARSISLQSPLLRDEEEGRPSYLAPSFVGRHEASTLQNSAVVLSADTLARYPQTHSHMPQLPPVDYELYELCMRLGVGQQTVLYHYHERILQEWRLALHYRRRAAKQSDARTSSVAHPVTLATEDVHRMVGLVRDRSLQVSAELVSLVEAYVAADGEQQS